jgi:hypothetical protein
MKNMKKLLVLAIVVLGFATSSFAQVSATATASGTIVSPIAITKTQDLNFGNVAVSATPGSVILAPDASRSITGGVTLPAVSGTVTAAHFDVTGTPSYTYAITLPSTSTTVSSGTDNMLVDDFTSFPATTGTLDATGVQTVNVGATLNVDASQAPGTYTSAVPFEVTVNYN